MDLRFAIRSLRKTPGLTLLAVVVLALGIGANSAIFSVVNTVLLKPLDYKQPDRIVTVATKWKKSGRLGQVSAPDFHDWRNQSSAFAAFAYYAADESTVVVNSRALYANATAVSPGFFQAMGAEPMLGRTFSSEDENPGAPLVVVISHAFWLAQFGGDSHALGQTIRAADHVFTIAGVLPARLDFPNQTDIWFPSWIIPETQSRTGHNYRVVARLKPGVTVEQAQQQMDVIANRLAQQYPKEDGLKGIGVVLLKEQIVANVKLTLWVLLGSVGMVLLIACANVANLLLSKASSRVREIAIRAAVGASRARVIRQLITESLVLGLLAGAAGLVLGIWCMDALVALAPANVPRLHEIRLDGAVILFTGLIAVVGSVLFGLAPALTASRVDIGEALKQGARNAGLARSGGLRSGLVIAEVALSVVLVCGAGLLIQSLMALNKVDWGVQTSHVLVADTQVAVADQAGARRATAFYADLLLRLESMPGITAVGGTAGLPGTPRSDGSYFIPGGPTPEQIGISGPQAVFSVVTPGYFRALGVPVRSGRDFSVRDTYDAPRVAIVNEAFAKQTFPNEDPIGKQVYCGLDMESAKPMTIVGVVADVRQYGPAVSAPAELIMAFQQHPQVASALKIVARTSGDPEQMAEAIRRTIRASNPEVPVKFTTMDAEVSRSTANSRFRATLLGLFAGLALVLAMAGVYGVMAYSVTSRAAEIGVRMALGASSSDVLRMVLGEGLKLGAIGVALGVAGALGATRLLTSVLFYVHATDPWTYLGVALLLGFVTLMAACVPALRASNLDPLKVLREE